MAEEDLGFTVWIKCEEFRQGHRKTVEDLAQRTYRGRDGVAFNAADRAVCQAGAACKLALRQAMHVAQIAQTRAHPL